MEENKKPADPAIIEPSTQPLVESEIPQPESHSVEPAPGGTRVSRFKSWYRGHKRWTIPLTLLIFILILAAVPFSRYGIVGVVRKTNVELRVTDSTANTPVSGALVRIGNISAQTNNNGVADLHGIKTGPHTVTISKKYYQAATVSILAPIFSQKNVPDFQLTATGRQVKIEVRNLIDKTPLSNVEIEVAGTTAKTDQTGSAIIVLPADRAEQQASLSLGGYNNAKVTVKVSNDKIESNQYNLTPAGKVYFLSNLSGNIDVVKTNLDGTDRQTVLAGTGNEDSNNTVLLASRDWKYLALLSRRAGDNPSLYLIDTADDSVTTIDSGNIDFSLAGWVGDYFVYTETRNDLQLWQSGQQVLKSYNATAKKSIVLDQTSASGSDQSNYLSQQIGSVYAYDNYIYYVKQWSGGYEMDASPQLATKSSTFDSVKPDGTYKTAIKSFTPDPKAQSFEVSMDTQIITPNSIEIHFYDGTKDSFYSYTNGQVTTDSSETLSKFYSGSYPTYLLSPSGNQTFWSDIRDGKNTLFVGNGYGQNAQQIATLSDYSPYGWYTDEYLMVSKNGSELYVMTKDGSQSPIKISDYYKPEVTLYGYGGGYGGL